ncbi:hypothetical protein FH972_021567 [Carpinus fangiana]|uniref:Nodulin-like domain-containing protein n=1 Tax=Carpinus fangiana TaxID=176857 RepID=A0A5N6KQA7_9ROSI|nr:hypothetical protein FH972_021567 [Carpinus fangiana]
MGMYAMGIPAGILVDNRGPRWGVLVGAVSLACGYFPIYKGFGLSAFFFAALANVTFSNNTGDFLLLLAAGTLCLNAASFFFIRLIPSSKYSSIPSDDDAEPNRLHLTKSHDSEPSQQRGEFDHDSQAPNTSQPPGRTDGNGQYGGISSLESGTFEQHRHSQEESDHEDDAHHKPPTLDITGLALLKHIEFWQLFAMMGLLAGVGLMTIK